MARLVAEKSDVIPVISELFRKYGFEGTSISHILEATRLGRSSIYHFFPGGKDEMAETVLENVDQWFEENMFQPLENSNSAQASVLAIEDMLKNVTAYFKSGQRICLVGAFALEETRSKFEEQLSSYFERWIDVLASNFEKIGLSKADANSKSVHFVSSIQGAIVVSRATQNYTHFESVMKVLSKTIK